MKNFYKIFSFCFLCSFVLFLTTGDAYADNVLQAVRSKALGFLQSLRPVIFILAGFGLVGFAWMAIFNKISWKWFANIAMGLFLVANMGLVVDYFSGNDGQRRQLGYGNYLNQPDYMAISGVTTGPKSQNAKNDGAVTGKEGKGETPNSDSNQINDDECKPPLTCAAAGKDTPKTPNWSAGGGALGENAFPGLSLPVSKADAKTPETCEKAGGRWDMMMKVCL